MARKDFRMKELVEVLHQWHNGAKNPLSEKKMTSVIITNWGLSWAKRSATP